MKDILIVEDNRELAVLLRDFLLKENYTAEIAESGEKALEFFETRGAKLVVLDIMLPGIDGFAVCKKIREKADVPILVVSAKAEKEDKLKGLVLGADDYIEKPYDIDIMLAKIQGIFKRKYFRDEIVSGDITVNRANHIALKNGEPIEMTSKELELLTIFLENEGKTLTKEFLFNKVWGDLSFSEQQTLTVHIRWLRQKIEDNPTKPQRIQTVWGVGYKYERI